MEAGSDEKAKKEVVNLHPWTEMAKLPEGIGFVPGDERSKRGTVQIGRFILKSLQESRYRPEIYDLSDPERLVGEILPDFIGSDRPGIPEYIIEKLLAQFPNLCWMRGGDVCNVEDEVERLSFFGADGYLGDMGAWGWVGKGYGGEQRKHPALYVARLEDVVQRVKDKALKIGSHHGYDVSLWGKESIPFREWNRRCLKVYDLSDLSPEVKQTAKELFFSKAVNNG